MPTLINPSVFWGQESSLSCTHPVPLHIGQGLLPVLQYKCFFTIIKAWDLKKVLENKSGRRIHISACIMEGRLRQNRCLVLSQAVPLWQCWTWSRGREASRLKQILCSWCSVCLLLFTVSRVLSQHSDTQKHVTQLKRTQKHPNQTQFPFTSILIQPDEDAMLLRHRSKPLLSLTCSSYKTPCTIHIIKSF